MALTSSLSSYQYQFSSFPIRKTSSSSIYVSTKTVPEKQLVIIENMNADDLKSLKKTDAFLYYSIPVAKRSAILMQDTETSDEVQQGCDGSACSPRLETAQDNKSGSSLTVTRRSCISFESHPDLLLEDLLLQCADDDLDDTDDPLSMFLNSEGAEDPLNTLLALTSSSNGHLSYGNQRNAQKILWASFLQVAGTNEDSIHHDKQ